MCRSEQEEQALLTHTANGLQQSFQNMYLVLLARYVVPLLVTRESNIQQMTNGLLLVSTASLFNKGDESDPGSCAASR